MRRGSVEIAVGAIKTFAKWTVKPMTDGGATPRPLKSEITRQSNVDDVRMWLTTCFMDLELDSRPVKSKIRVPLFAARTLNATGYNRATLSARQENF